MGIARSAESNEATLVASVPNEKIARRQSKSFRIEKREIATTLSTVSDHEDEQENLEELSPDFEGELFTSKDLSNVYEQLKMFLKIHEQEPVDISVEFAEVKRSLLKGKTMYFNVTVKLDGKLYTSKRKYEEFVTLAECLRERLKGSSVPPLNKKGIGNETDSVLNVINGLQAFLVAVVRHPFLKNDTALLYFFTSHDKFKPKYLQNLKDTSNSLGYTRWIEMIQLCKTPSKPLKQLKAVQNEINILRTFYRSFKQAIKTHIARIETFAAGINEFGTVFDNWKLVEGMELPVLTGVVGIAHENEVSKSLPISGMLAKFEETCGGQAKQLRETAKALANIVNGPLTFEVMVLETFKDDVKYVKESIQKFRKMNKKYKEALENFNSKCTVLGDDQGTISTPEKLKENLDAARAAKDNALEEAHLATRAFLVIEVQRFRYERAMRATEILERISKLNLEFCLTLSTLWKQTSESIPSEVQACSDFRLLELIREQDKDGLLAKQELNSPTIATPTNGFEEDFEYDDQELKNNVEDLSQNGLEGDDFDGSITAQARVLHDFEAENENELSVVAGTLVSCVFSNGNPDWAWVTDPATGNQGYVPTNHVESWDNDTVEESKSPTGSLQRNDISDFKRKELNQRDLLTTIQGFNKSSLKAT